MILRIEQPAGDYTDGKGIFALSASIGKGEVRGFLSLNGAGKGCLGRAARAALLETP